MSEDKDDDKPGRLGLTEELIAAHAEEMTKQAWWPIYAAEAELPPCPICGDRQRLALDGSAVCENNHA